MTQTMVNWQKMTDLTGWDGKEFSFDVLIDDAIETVRVCRSTYTMVIFNDEKCISIGINDRNPFLKFDRGAYIDPDGFLWVGNTYED